MVGGGSNNSCDAPDDLGNTTSGNIVDANVSTNNQDNPKAPKMALSNLDPKSADKINEYQSKMRVLLYNYQILERNDLNLPDETVAANKIKIEKYLVKLTKKQNKLTEKLLRSECKTEVMEEVERSPETSESRNDVKNSENGSNDDDDVDSMPTKSANVSPTPLPPEEELLLLEEEEEEEEETSDPAEPEPEAPTTPPETAGTTSPVASEAAAAAVADDDNSNGGGNIKDRMAIVRGMRKKKRNGGGGGGGGNGSQSSARARQRNERALSNAAALGLDVNAELVLQPGQFRGDITEDEISDTAVRELPEEATTTVANGPDTDAKVDADRKENTFNAIQLDQFMLNLGLLTPEGSDQFNRKWLDVRKRKNDWRDLTYVPEITDQKQRVRYTYLSPEIGSPPMLRARQNAAAGGRRPAVGGTSVLPRKPDWTT